MGLNSIFQKVTASLGETNCYYTAHNRVKRLLLGDPAWKVVLPKHKAMPILSPSLLPAALRASRH